MQHMVSESVLRQRHDYKVTLKSEVFELIYTIFQRTIFICFFYI